jgi:N-methylhydantoinase A
MPLRYRLGIDIGGTFTDATLLDEETGEMRIAKVATTPADPALGFMEAVGRLLRQAEVDPSTVRYIVHATTVATNSIIEGKVARTGFITTDGFRDMLEIARQVRPSLYDLQFEKPRPLVPRHLCFGVPERLDAHGKVVRPLDEEAVQRVAEQLRRERVESVAVCLLHSYVNPQHERRVGEIVRACCPDIVVSLSSEVAPEFREYLRASTTVINACIQPIVARYLQNIDARLRQAGLSGELLVMQSNGGVLTAPATCVKPVFMVESGPAAGVMAATFLGTALGHRDLLSLDMGGTTAKAGLILNGAPRITKDYQVGAAAGTGPGSRGHGGYPIRTPVLDLVEIGAGGGSIAWVDVGGMLRVGPASAGADPGPACYGKGGQDPTVTDANLVLGRLNPSFFLGGEIELDTERARQAIARKCAGPLGMDTVATAHAIVEIANTAMVNALRLVSVQRGYDPRDFTLIAFGGAGPVHANRLAAETAAATTVIPLGPGITSAMGLLVTDLQHEYSVTVLRRADQLDLAAIDASCRELEAKGEAALRGEGVLDAAMRFERHAELRYLGQSFELAVPLPPGRLEREQLDAMLERFHGDHARTYGYNAPAEPVEWVNLRLIALGVISKPRLREAPGHERGAVAARKADRSVFFAESYGFVECPIYDRYLLGAGCELLGPAVVEEIDSTTVIHHGYRAVVDRFGNLLLTRQTNSGG